LAARDAVTSDEGPPQEGFEQITEAPKKVQELEEELQVKLFPK